MSQVGTILSVDPQLRGSGIHCWYIEFSYVRDDNGQTAVSNCVVGNTYSPPANNAAEGTSPMYASATSQITVGPNPPGVSANPVLLNCPPLMQWAVFGANIAGLPVR